MSATKSGKKGTFSLTLLDGLPVSLTEEDILTLARRHRPTKCTKLALRTGESLLVKETVRQVLDACEAAEGKA